MSDFTKFSKPVFKRFQEMSKHELFVVDISGDELYQAYLKAFPEGTNPIHKTRTEHDCSCCKNFIRNIGNVVAVIDGRLVSVWGTQIDEYPYRTVADALADLVESKPIVSLFRTSEKTYGSVSSKQLLVDGSVKTWNHFHANIDKRHQTVGDTAKGDYATAVGVFKRGLEELNPQAVDDVLELIQSNALYRGEEHKAAVVGFQKAQHAYFKLKTDEARNIFVWTLGAGTGIATHGSAARFRNTVIGTLVQDLSEGVELTKAVASFEAKVAPTNYKRPTALITPRMVQDAMKTINELGYLSALERRLANISDVSVNNVLWVDNSVKNLMKLGLEDALMKAAVSPKAKKAPTSTDEISIEDFMSTVLPTASSIDVLVGNEHLSNFATITAPVHDEGIPLFKWDNGFGWSYDGNITDSIKERVKAAGGNVTNAKLRVSLAWFNPDDLDIYVREPNGFEICFHSKISSRTGGFLDVDMNAYGKSHPTAPVENVSWANKVPDGTYKVSVNQYNQRSTSNVGFVVEVESNGKLSQLSYQQAVKGTITVADLIVKDGVVVEVRPGKNILGQGITQEKWGIKTEEYAKVKTVMFSPNYWDENAVGNKHWFFILEGCKTDQTTRGIYNEFLNSTLDKHRKVFEVLGDKTKCPVVDDQLSGLGFSSTGNQSLTVRVQGAKLSKTYIIKF